MIEQMVPTYGEEEIEAVVSYLRSGGWLTEFKKTRELESMIAQYVSTKHCIMVPNATLALYAMLKVLRIGVGDRVIVPAFTMVATANAVRMAGAMVTFVDIDSHTLCLDLTELEEVLNTDRFKAVLLVSLNGRSPDMKALGEILSASGTLLLEDAAQALGSCYRGEHLGTFGHAGVFSFSAPKIITMGQGGCIVTDDDELAAGLRSFRDFGRPRGGCDDYQSFGINLKYTDLQAAFGIEQMKKLPARTERKKAIYELYRLRLQDVVEFTPTNLNHTTPWFVDILVDRRDELQAFLLDKGVKTRAFYPALPTCPAWKFHKHIACSVAKDISARGLWLPSSVSLTDADIEKVCADVRVFYE